VSGTRLVQAPGGKARSFNGVTDYLYAADSASLGTATGLSVEVLFRVDHIDGVQTLASKSWSSKTGEGYTLWVNGNKFEFLVYDGSGSRVDLDYSRPDRRPVVSSRRDRRRVDHKPLRGREPRGLEALQRPEIVKP
jgi:hypothetical protein